jgi:protoporphyrinogen/coproporphyrinogen III oxidase
MVKNSAVVVGGGFAGLTAGYYLSKAGWNVSLLEASAEVGGRVRTVRKQGYTFDVGATQMSTGYREYLALCDEFGMREQMVQSSPFVGILKKGRIHVIDGRSLLSSALTPALSLRSKFTLLKTIGDAMAIRPPVDVFDVSRSHVVDVESAAHYAERRLNRELFDVLVDPLIRAYVMNSAEQVSALEWFSSLKNLGGQTMLSLNGGNDRLPKRLAEHLDVRLHTQALSVAKTRSGVEVTLKDSSGLESRVSAQACVLATRLHEAIAICPAVRRTAGGLGERLRYNRAWVAQLGYRKTPQSKIVGLLIPAAEQPEISLLWLEHNKNPDRAPPGHALFSVYSDEAANDSCYGRSDAALARLGSEFIERLFPELQGHLDVTQVTRWPCAIPNTAPGIYKEMSAMKERMDARDPVQLAGDFLTCTGQNSAIFYGKRAAENIVNSESAVKIPA